MNSTRAIQILIVDDLIDELEILAARLEGPFARRLGCTVKVTGVLDGYSGLEAMSQQRFDLVLTDLVMGGMEGYDLVWRTRFGEADAGPQSTPRDVPIITASARTEGPREADAHIIKPWNFRELEATVERLLMKQS